MSKETVIDDIIQNYEQLEQSLIKELHMRNSIHGGTTGHAREGIWRKMFERIIPKKFVVEQSVFIIDSTYNSDESLKGISAEIDLAIIDENFTPYIFRSEGIKYVPIEAVAVVIECKSKSASTKRIKNWSERIDALATSNSGIARMAGNMVADGLMIFQENEKPVSFPTQTKTRPIKIYCSLEDSANYEIESCFDFVIKAHENKGCIKIHPIADRNLFDWYHTLNQPQNTNPYLSKYTLKNDYTIKRKNEDGETEVSLLTFNFQLNQLLMLINNPLLFPHQSYVKMFNKQPG